MPRSTSCAANSPPPGRICAPAAPPSAGAPVATDQIHADLTDPAPLTDAAFAAQLDRLGPFEPAPRLAVAVSGGPDSTALTLLAAAWARARGGSLLALTVDHGLRPAAAAEAQATAALLATHGIATRVLTLHALAPGPGLAARARAARLTALIAAAHDAGIAHLLLGHHAADQAETHLMRARAGSGPAGLAAIAALRACPDLRILRPLLETDPAVLRCTLRARAIPWISDPSNHDPATGRAALRAELAAAAPATHAVLRRATHTAAAARAAADQADADQLAQRARISRWGWAVLTPGPIRPSALAALWQSLSGRPYPPPSAAIAALAEHPGPATLAGLRMLPAGTLGPGWLILREHAPKPVPARNGARWDRFILQTPDPLPPGTTLGALTTLPPRPRTYPAALLRVLPALAHHGVPVAIPALGWTAPGWTAPDLQFRPAIPAAGAPWRGILPLRDA